MGVRRSLRRLGWRNVMSGMVGLVAGVVASPFVLLWDVLGASRRFQGRWIARFFVLIVCLTLTARPRSDGDEEARLRWLDRAQGTPQNVAHVPYAGSINSRARAVGLDPRLVAAVIAVESSYRAGAVSHKGAMGLMQVMPATWGDVAGKASPHTMLDPESNIRVGTTYLARMLSACDGRVGRALAAYNGGLNRLEDVRQAVARADMSGEPARYVTKVYLEWDALCERPSPPLPMARSRATRDMTLLFCGVVWLIAFAWVSINCFRWVSNPRALKRRMRW